MLRSCLLELKRWPGSTTPESGYTAPTSVRCLSHVVRAWAIGRNNELDLRLLRVARDVISWFGERPGAGVPEWPFGGAAARCTARHMSWLLTRSTKRRKVSSARRQQRPRPRRSFALGDELVFHDQLLSKGKPAGDDLGSCVIAAITPELLANCTLVIRLPGGSITGQFVATAGPTPKELALTGGTGSYRNAGGEGTLVEFGNGKGRMTLDVLRFAPREARAPDTAPGADYRPDLGGVRAEDPGPTARAASWPGWRWGGRRGW
jgi:hypothetical protein